MHHLYESSKRSAIDPALLLLVILCNTAHSCKKKDLICITTTELSWESCKRILHSIEDSTVHFKHADCFPDNFHIFQSTETYPFWQKQLLTVLIDSTEEEIGSAMFESHNPQCTQTYNDQKKVVDIYAAFVERSTLKCLAGKTFQSVHWYACIVKNSDQNWKICH